MTKRIMISLAAIGLLLPLAAIAQKVRPVQQLAVYDANGKKVGVVAGANVNASIPVVAFKIDGVPFMLAVLRDGFQAHPQVAWESTDCTGTPFLIMNGEGYGYSPSSLPSIGVTLPGNTVYIEDGPARTITVGSQSASTIYADGRPASPLYRCTRPPFPWRAVSLPARPLIDMLTEFKAPFTVR